MSLPARGVWIEIEYLPYLFTPRKGHSPQGECGLKYQCEVAVVGPVQSLPARGVWIEISGESDHTAPGGVTPRKGSVN